MQNMQWILRACAWLIFNSSLVDFSLFPISYFQNKILLIKWWFCNFEALTIICFGSVKFFIQSITPINMFSFTFSLYPHFKLKLNIFQILISDLEITCSWILWAENIRCNMFWKQIQTPDSTKDLHTRATKNARGFHCVWLKY